MGKKKAFTKGGSKAMPKKNIFKVADVTHKKKPKAVQSKIKKIQAKVSAQNEASDKKLKSLHEEMVVKKSNVAPQRQINAGNKKSRKPAPNTKAVQENLQKMNV